MADLEEPRTTTGETDPETAPGPGFRGIFQTCSLVILYSRTAPEEPFSSAEGIYIGVRSGRQGGPLWWEGTADAVHQSFCSVAAAVEEPCPTSAGESGSEPMAGDALGRGGNRGIERSAMRDDRDRSPCPPAGPGRSRQDPRRDASSPRGRRDSGVVLEETAPPRESQGA